MIDLLFKSKFRHPKNACFDGEDQDEKILYIFRRSFITNFDWIFVSIFLLFTPTFANTILYFADNDTKKMFSAFFIFVLNIFWYIFAFGYIFQNFINWYFNVYIVTTKRIMDIDFVGFLYKNISEASIHNIEDVTSNVSGALRVIFNYGSVLIQTAAETKEFEFSDVANPAQVRDIISDIVTTDKSGGNVYDK